MPKINDIAYKEVPDVPIGGKGIGSYAAKLELGRHQRLSPDEASNHYCASTCQSNLHSCKSAMCMVASRQTKWTQSPCWAIQRH